MNPPPRDSETRNRILEAGAQAISAKGFNGCGLNEILQFAGVPKGSFYHYFRSKEEFGVALIEMACDEHVAWLRPLISDRKLRPIERLRAVFQASYEECRQHGGARQCLIPRLALETSQLSDAVHAAVKCAYQQWSAMLAQVIREGQASGEIACVQDPDRLANVLVMLWEGATLRSEIDRSTQPLDDFLSFVFDSLLGERA